MMSSNNESRKIRRAKSWDSTSLMSQLVRARILGLIAILTSGCVTTTTKNGHQIPNEPSAFSKEVHELGASLSGFVESVTPSNGAEPLTWEWAVGIPRSLSKGDVAVSVPNDAVVAFAPAAHSGNIRLVSADTSTPLSIAAVNNKSVRTLDDLNMAVERVADQHSGVKEKGIVVEFVGGSTDSASVPVTISSDNFVALAHACIPDQTQVRAVIDGNPWVVTRNDAVRCKTMLRKERHSKLVHLVMSLKVCWGQPQKLPASIAMSCEGKPLNCLTVSEVLDQLYGERKKRPRTAKSITSYAEVSEDDEFLTPVNYRKLEAKLANDQRLASIRPYPAFASVGGHTYPGPAVLGDARALSGFMLQPRVFSPKDEEQVGWIVFDGSSVPDGEAYELLVDLGSGPLSVQFKVPNVEK
jgi:hypothetical protein